ncbi:MAG: helix-turn-helix domain-containing protein [Rhodothermales bacterium]
MPSSPDTDRQVFAAQLREAIHRRALTQAQLADRLGVTQPAVNDWVNAKKMPGRKNMKKLVALLDLPGSLVYPSQNATPENAGGQITILFTLNQQPFIRVNLSIRSIEAAGEQVTLDVPVSAGAILKGDLKGNIKGEIKEK